MFNDFVFEEEEEEKLNITLKIKMYTINFF